MERPIEVEHLKAMLKDSPESELEKGDGTSLNTSTSDSGLKDSKPLNQETSRSRCVGGGCLATGHTCRQ